jgi:aspartate kinase
MKVYKFGGASVRNAEGVRNLAAIVGAEGGPLFVVVSAMGKTTNALEGVLERFMAGGGPDLADVRKYHEDICAELFGKATDEKSNTHSCVPERARAFFDELEQVMAAGPQGRDYDYWYDRIVSYGELVSSSIVAEFLGARWIDARANFVTDSRHRDANVDLDETGRRLQLAAQGAQVCVTQGFIGASRGGETTTLGREGSDYSAAVAAYVLGAESLTIWKDVPGVMNADPKFFPGAVFIPELTYLDAVELAYSGAQIIHPKTIKPLQNKGIPLYVRPFGAPAEAGSVVHGEMEGRIGVPVLILKHNQVLVSVRPRDFSFVLEERLAEIFELLASHGVRANLIQSSAVNLSLCVDASRRLGEVVGKLTAEGFRVVYNEGLELLTVRGYTPELLEKYASGTDILLMQKTRRTLRVVRRRS